MKLVRVAVAFLFVLAVFAASAFLANTVFALSNCLWTSSGTFGVTFVAISAALLSFFDHFVT